MPSGIWLGNSCGSEVLRIECLIRRRIAPERNFGEIFSCQRCRLKNYRIFEKVEIYLTYSYEVENESLDKLRTF